MEVILQLSVDSRLRFTRVNDLEFEVFRGKYGDIMMKVGRFVKPLPYFNYVHDEWIRKETKKWI